MSRKIETLSVDGMTVNVTEEPNVITGSAETWSLVALHQILKELRALNRKMRNIEKNTRKVKA